jgi:hypothetical protein
MDRALAALDRDVDRIPPPVRRTLGFGHTVGIGSIDLVFLNGVIGWGLNDPGEAEATFDCLGKCLRPGGHLIVGWNDIPEHNPFEFTTLKTLKAFNPMTFEPLSAQEFLVANEWRHTFSLFERAFLPSSGA